MPHLSATEWHTEIYPELMNCCCWSNIEALCHFHFHVYGGTAACVKKKKKKKTCGLGRLQLGDLMQPAPCLTSKTTSCVDDQNSEVLGCNTAKRDTTVILTNTLWKPFSVPARENEKIQYRSVYSYLCAAAASLIYLTRVYRRQLTVWWKIWARLKNNVLQTRGCFRERCRSPKMTFRENKPDWWKKYVIFMSALVK